MAIIVVIKTLRQHHGSCSSEFIAGFEWVFDFRKLVPNSLITMVLPYEKSLDGTKERNIWSVTAENLD